MGPRTHVGPTCVSCRPYFCRGSWHYPQDFYEYDEVGLASWYGQDCHGKPKATGEKFDKMDMTAAHKTLPLPTVVRVTNLRNNKSIVVVVDDRGPFYYKGRIIDLSYGVAKYLDLHRFKPSPVRVQALVSDSLKLSHYIAKNCKHRKDKYGRSWYEVYAQEIAKISPRVYKKHVCFADEMKHDEKKNRHNNANYRGKMNAKGKGFLISDNLNKNHHNNNKKNKRKVDLSRIA